MAGYGRCPLLRAIRVWEQNVREGRADGELAGPLRLGGAHKMRVDTIPGPGGGRCRWAS
jgi:hypothetical protein